QVNLGLLREALADVVDVEFESPDEICVALLDDVGGVVARSLAGFEAEWRRPFVSTEINEVLPRWEVAAYLVNPGAIGEVAKLARLRLGLTVVAVLAAIGVGGLLIFLDYRRQEMEARQKTDFVSNVSHELKTPLTSIRMFSDLLGGEGAVDDGKRRRYAEVIQGEAGRLTRLINNVLDFSRLERGTREFERRETDLVRLVRETVEHYRPGLEKAGFTVELELSEVEAEIRGDADALAQVVVNLLSNAEKYGGGESNEVRVELVVSAGAGKVEVRVCDRGGGVGRGVQRKMFERFFRAEASLNCGIQGSGLGLTLARQIARAHGGDVSYRERDGGGSVFVLELPLANRSEAVGRVVLE
ncbi:MAG: HAMP domain-containing sensor histidine kinase, partial [Verrucomicrobiales bacterium]|nr:HAMP domain-containing sensor histidine kinase [Verrucomicrobiales bacterium]